MKRRFFVRSVAVSAVGVGVIPSQLTAMVNPAHLLVRSIRQLASLLKAAERDKSSCGSAQLKRLIQQTNERYAALGFRESGSSCFFSGHNSYCYYPLAYHHPSVGTLEVLLPVFHRDSEGQWKLLKTFSGFQIEALAKAASAISDSGSGQLHDLLFPVNREPVVGIGGKYYTKSGTVQIVTTCISGNGHTTCTVQGTDGVEYTESFKSRHALRF